LLSSGIGRCSVFKKEKEISIFKRKRNRTMGKRSRYTIITKNMVIEPDDKENVWEGDWTISIFDEMKKQIPIGKASFAGVKEYGTIPVRVELDEEYRNRKYGTEAFKLLVDFAFGFKNIYEVKAETDYENDKCRYALEKAGFVHRSKEGHIETLSIIKPRTTWLGLYLYIGVVCGLVIGIVVANSWVGLAIGIVIGLFLGSIMDTAAKKEREKVVGHKI